MQELQQLFQQELSKIIEMKKLYSPTELGTTAKVAKLLGVGATTLTAAVTVGHVESVQLGCGSRVVVIKSAQTWYARERKPGPKPSK